MYIGFYKIFRLPFNLCNLNKTQPNSPLQNEGVKVAFTLAEVLITLGIIGVVAAITMPTLIQKHREQVTVNKVKKFYSTMSQALQMSIKDNGYLDEWDVADGISEINSVKVMDYLRPYLNISNDYGTQTTAFPYIVIKKLNEQSGNMYYLNDNRYYKALLSDGSLFWFRSTPAWCKTSDANMDNVCIAFWLDVNGIQNPNVLGRDVFLFVAVKNGLYAGQRGDCNLASDGWDCSAEILTKGNMDYLHQ